MLAGVLVPQLVYVGFNFLPETAVLGLTLFSDSYFEWGIALYCMLLGAVVTLGVSRLTTQAADEDTDLYFGLEAD